MSLSRTTPPANPALSAEEPEQKSYHAESARVALLSPQVAARIAAGEVIERPESIVRELLDNAIDAGSTEISLFLEEGGLSLIRVTDNGYGMLPEDLNLCLLPHATSKLQRLDDLETLSSLGFRGEALASIAASARLRVRSRHLSEEIGYELKEESHAKYSLEPTSMNHGTIVEVRDLFYAIPARKKFLKGTSAEFRRCRKLFLQKALSSPKITFRLFHNRENVDILIQDTLLQRYLRILNKREVTEQNCVLLTHEEETFSLQILSVTPSFYRKDRKGVALYCNDRPIDEYGFTQAACHGYEQVLPGGLFPYVTVLIHADSRFVDFNIHPAKREARFRNQKEIHRAISRTLKSHLLKYQQDPHLDRRRGTQSLGEQSPPLPFEEGENSLSQERLFPLGDDPATDPTTGSNRFIPKRAVFSRENLWVGEPLSSYTPSEQEGISPPLSETFSSQEGADLKNEQESQNQMDPSSEISARYLGQFLNLYLLVEVGERLLVMDQHAAHETVLLDEIKKNPPAAQELLIPILFEVEESESRLIESKREALREIGVSIHLEGENQWVLESLPGGKRISEEELLSLLKSPLCEVEDLKILLYEKMACRKATKEGEALSEESAKRLAEATIRLTQGRCPHGRPLWYELTKDELDKFVLRTI